MRPLRSIAIVRLGLGLAAACLALTALAAAAAGKGLINGSPVQTGVALHGSPHRYLTLAPAGAGVTVVARVDRRGGKIDRWWALPNVFTVTAPAYDLVGAGLSADERVLVLTRMRQSLLLRRTRLAILDTTVHAYHPAARRNGDVNYVTLRGDYGVHAVSQDGGTVFLTHLLSAPPDPVRFTLRALDTASGRLLPRFSIPGNGEILSGLPITRLADRRGRVAYTLYWEEGGNQRVRPVSLLVLDTAAPRLRRVELPQLRRLRDPMLLRLRLDKSGRQLTVGKLSRSGRDRRPEPLLRINTETLRVRRAEPVATASAFGHVPSRLLAWAETPRRPGNLLGRRALIGRSAQGRRIGMYQTGDPAIDGSLLVFGCIHGDECAGSAVRPLAYGCPDPYSDILVVPNLNPDGEALGTRLNGRGVDLNRNFPAGWRPLGERWDPQYSGPRPFSEPETRLAARIVRAARPEATVWFHQYRGDRAFVRAWGPSIPAAREFARGAGIELRRLPWLAGTAPHWQNRRFPGAAAFVVELPAGELGPGLETRLSRAVVRLGRQVGEA